MSKYVKYCFVLLLLFNTRTTDACSCGPLAHDFLINLRSVLLNYNAENLDKSTLVVTKGIIVGVTSNQHGALFVPIFNYYGKTYKDTVIIWGSDGVDCRRSVQGNYKVPADTFIFLMNRNLAREYDYEDTGDFHISACGNDILEVRNDSVFGGYPGTFAYSGFPLVPFENDSLNFWLHTLKVPAIETAFQGYLYPNPASQTKVMLLHGKFPEDLDILVYDVTGRIIQRSSKPAHNSSQNDIPIQLAGLKEGAYFLKICSVGRLQVLPFTIVNQ